MMWLSVVAICTQPVNLSVDSLARLAEECF